MPRRFRCGRTRNLHPNIGKVSVVGIRAVVLPLGKNGCFFVQLEYAGGVLGRVRPPSVLHFTSFVPGLSLRTEVRMSAFFVFALFFKSALYFGTEGVLEQERCCKVVFCQHLFT